MAAPSPPPRHGAELLGSGPRVHVIPHGAFDHLTRQPDERTLPPELAAVEGPVVLCFGVVRPYKGVDVLVNAFRSVEGAELWVVGRPLGVSLDSLGAPPHVRFVPRYVSDAELPAFFRRADLLVLPHRTVDVSGVLAAGLAFGKPMVLSDVGGFRELVEEHGAGRLVPPPAGTAWPSSPSPSSPPRPRKTWPSWSPSCPPDSPASRSSRWAASAASTSTPLPSPIAAVSAATTSPSSRACASGACHATSWTSASTPATWSRSSASRSTRTPTPRSRSTWRAATGWWACSAGSSIGRWRGGGRPAGLKAGAGTSRGRGSA